MLCGCVLYGQELSTLHQSSHCRAPVKCFPKEVNVGSRLQAGQHVEEGGMLAAGLKFRGFSCNGHR
jgi:hypothetical protein